jgi:hypothetical protein
MITDEKARGKISSEATYLANELARQLIAPSLILEDSEKRLKKEKFNFLREGAIRNFCIAYRKFKHPFSLTGAISPHGLAVNRTNVWLKLRCCGDGSDHASA